MEEGGTIVDDAARSRLKELHGAAAHADVPSVRFRDSDRIIVYLAKLRARIVQPVAVVDAPGITITEHFGHVASGDGIGLLGKAVVKGASEEAWQAPQFDEYVICAQGRIDFVHGDGATASIKAGEGIFLPKAMRVKWFARGDGLFRPVPAGVFTGALGARGGGGCHRGKGQRVHAAPFEQLHKERQVTSQ